IRNPPLGLQALFDLGQSPRQEPPPSVRMLPDSRGAEAVPPHPPCGHPSAAGTRRFSPAGRAGLCGFPSRPPWRFAPTPAGGIVPERGPKTTKPARNPGVFPLGIPRALVGRDHDQDRAYRWSSDRCLHFRGRRAMLKLAAIGLSSLLGLGLAG